VKIYETLILQWMRGQGAHTAQRGREKGFMQGIQMALKMFLRFERGICGLSIFLARHHNNFRK
jgi:hypothetical protein